MIKPVTSNKTPNTTKPSAELNIKAPYTMAPNPRINNSKSIKCQSNLKSVLISIVITP